MKRIIGAIFLALALLSFAGYYACQYPVDASKLPDAKRFIAIDAELTNTYGKVDVRYTLTDVTSKGGYIIPDRPTATAYVLDSQGNRTDFGTDGTKNTAFAGVVGETYKLYVEADGEVYESLAETMQACPELDSLEPVYARETHRDPASLFYDGFDVYAEFQDIPGQENYYQWDWIHYERLPSCGTAQENGQTVKLPCNPIDCWGITYNTKVVVQSDKLRDGQPIAHKIVRVPFATPPNRYYLRVEQRAITPTVYAYLKSLETQTQNVGTIYDIPAQTLFSPNIHNVNKPAEQILGVFNVFSARHKIIYIDMLQQIPGAQVKAIPDLTPFTASPFASAPCVEGLYRTQIRPEGWKD